MDELWIPILAASAICLTVAVLAQGVLPHHNREQLRIPTEAQMLEALRKDMPPPGTYQFPFRGFSGENAARIDVAANLERGPVGYLTVGKTGAPNIPARTLQHFVYFVVVNTLTAYLLTHAGLKDGAPFISVFRLAATISTMALVLGAVPQSIWFSRPWKTWVSHCADGLVCGAAIGATFAWFWPA